jgi:hypothetical protein
MGKTMKNFSTNKLPINIHPRRYKQKKKMLGGRKYPIKAAKRVNKTHESPHHEHIPRSFRVDWNPKRLRKGSSSQSSAHAYFVNNEEK